jgi:hypothetical protein
MLFRRSKVPTFQKMKVVLDQIDQNGNQGEVFF